MDECHRRHGFHKRSYQEFRGNKRSKECLAEVHLHFCLPCLLELQPHLADLQPHEHGLSKKYRCEPGMSTCQHFCVDPIISTSTALLSEPLSVTAVWSLLLMRFMLYNPTGTKLKMKHQASISSKSFHRAVSHGRKQEINNHLLLSAMAAALRKEGDRHCQKHLKMVSQLLRSCVQCQEMHFECFRKGTQSNLF